MKGPEGPLVQVRTIYVQKRTVQATPIGKDNQVHVT